MDFGRLLGDRVALLGGWAGRLDLVLWRLDSGVLRRSRRVLGRRGRGRRLLQIGDRRRLAPRPLLGQIGLRHELRRRLSGGIGRAALVPRPLRLTERLVLELLQLGIARAMRALQIQVLTYCLVENAHQQRPIAGS